jgi:hypothetical protein
MKNWVFGLVLAGGIMASGVAQAQYSAPGFPMLPQHRLPPEPEPAPDPTALPRFWHETNPAKKEAGRNQFFEFVMAKAEYPAAARPPKGHPEIPMPTGRLVISVLVRSDGSVRQPRVAKRELALPEASYTAASIQALDAEALRVLATLHFVRSKVPVDSLLVPMRFIAQ